MAEDYGNKDILPVSSECRKKHELKRRKKVLTPLEEVKIGMIAMDYVLPDGSAPKCLPKGKKSYAVSFTLQDDSKTLTDKQTI